MRPKQNKTDAIAFHVFHAFLTDAIAFHVFHAFLIELYDDLTRR